MTNLTFTEYTYNAGTRVYEASGRSYELHAQPITGKITRSTDWRHRHSGTKRFKKTRFRGRETIQLAISGLCFGDPEANALQRLAMLNSRWVLTNLPLPTPNFTYSGNIDSETAETLYWIVTKTQVTRSSRKFMAESPKTGTKVNVYDYQLTLEAVRPQIS